MVHAERNMLLQGGGATGREEGQAGPRPNPKQPHSNRS
jgi:hypothetical protein